MPFPLISDAKLTFLTALALPTLQADGRVLSKRITLIVNDGAIEKCFYPVFPPDENAAQILAYYAC
ncbi:MAG: redoxin family protein [Immundisolibacteraceae bacterium]|nr:redoxin family protein [Immundisolibacteraceae bacterium]